MEERKHFFFREKRSKKASSVWLRDAAPGEAPAPISVTPKVGGWASPVVADSEPKSGSPFCFFFLQEKEVLPGFLALSKP
jgi:hypothetical protein